MEFLLILKKCCKLNRVINSTLPKSGAGSNLQIIALLEYNLFTLFGAVLLILRLFYKILFIINEL